MRALIEGAPNFRGVKADATKRLMSTFVQAALYLPPPHNHIYSTEEQSDLRTQEPPLAALPDCPFEAPQEYARAEEAMQAVERRSRCVLFCKCYVTTETYAEVVLAGMLTWIVAIRVTRCSA